MAGLREVPTGVKTLADLIAFNIAHADEELVPPYWTDQSVYVTDFRASLTMNLSRAYQLHRCR